MERKLTQGRNSKTVPISLNSPFHYIQYLPQLSTASCLPVKDQTKTCRRNFVWSWAFALVPVFGRFPSVKGESNFSDSLSERHLTWMLFRKLSQVDLSRLISELYSSSKLAKVLINILLCK